MIKLNRAFNPLWASCAILSGLFAVTMKDIPAFNTSDKTVLLFHSLADLLLLAAIGFILLIVATTIWGKET